MKQFLIALSLLAATTACNCNKGTSQCAPNTSCQKEEVKSVIFMIGDGMGLAQASMLMIENGYQTTAFDRAKNIALIKTYSANNRVTDSAAAGTALACAQKTNNKMIGVTADLDTCYSIATHAKEKGLSTGLVAACTVQHATPAAFYAHVDNRNDYELITRQLVYSNLDLIIGGGKKYFDQEIDGQKLTEIANKNGFSIVNNFDELSTAGNGSILGLFADGHIASMQEGRGDYLSKATTAAISRLSKNGKGFFLMVEGSQIDWSCHANDAEATLAEVADFNECVNMVMDYADRNPGTLVIITADHETGGLAAVSNNADFTLADSGVAYKYSTDGHSGILVPVYTYGTGAESINGIMENTELSNKISQILAL